VRDVTDTVVLRSTISNTDDDRRHFFLRWLFWLLREVKILLRRDLQHACKARIFMKKVAVIRKQAASMSENPASFLLRGQLYFRTIICFGNQSIVFKAQCLADGKTSYFSCRAFWYTSLSTYGRYGDTTFPSPII
jgi:hypothetical protein